MLRLPDLSLGDLEMATLECLWGHGEADVRAVHAAIGVSRGVTLNTVQSTLDRLHRKGLLTRRKLSHAFIYCSATPKAELVSRAIAAVIGMTGGGAGDLLTAFVDVAARTDPMVLAELETLLAARISANRSVLV